VSLIMMTVSLWGVFSFAQQQPRYPVDPQTKWAVGAKPKPADELKKQLDGEHGVDDRCSPAV
jgi:hypothetical protein